MIENFFTTRRPSIRVARKYRPEEYSEVFIVCEKALSMFSNEASYTGVPSLVRIDNPIFFAFKPSMDIVTSF